MNLVFGRFFEEFMDLVANDFLIGSVEKLRNPFVDGAECSIKRNGKCCVVKRVNEFFK